MLKGIEVEDCGVPTIAVAVVPTLLTKMEIPDDVFVIAI
jgi:hypothetical protein